MRNASAFVFPALYEGFGIPVIEAMACGIPVLSSTGGSAAEIAGDAAVLFDPKSDEAIASALKTFLQQPRLAKELRQKSLAPAQKFSWRLAARKYVEVAFDLVGSGPHPAT